MKPSIFTAWSFEFPYDYKFPGQSSDERILAIMREHPLLLLVKLVGVGLVTVITILLSVFISIFFPNGTLSALLSMIGFLFALVLGTVGAYWYISLWKKSIAIVTDQRLTKFIYTTPFNRHNLTLPLEMIVDTGSYSKGFFQAAFNIGTFTARSSASSSGAATDDPDRVNKKYYYIENVAAAEDLQHYVTKLLQARRTQPDRMTSFRPFVPHLKGEPRKKFLENYPHFWS